MIDTEGDYLEEPINMYSKEQITCSWILGKQEWVRTLEGFAAAKDKVIAGMQAFKNSCEVLTKLGSDKSISFTDMRVELAKLEAQYKQIKAEKAGVEAKFPSVENVELTIKFTELVGEKLKSCKEAGLIYL